MNQTNGIAGPIIARRGASGGHPENTLSAIRRAAAMGCRWVEIDAQVSRDGVAVLMHDYTVDRTTVGVGPVAMKTGEELIGLRMKHPQSGAALEETVPPLSDALARCVDLGLGVVLEIRATRGWDVEDAEIVAFTVDTLWPSDNADLIVTSTSPMCLLAFAKHCRWAKLGAALLAPPRDPKAMMRLLGVSAFHIDYRYVLPGDIKRLRDAGADVAITTVNKPKLAQRFLKEGAQGIITDCPADMLSTCDA